MIYVNDLYEKVIAECGCKHQIIVCIEELSELQKELCKELRYGCNISNIAEEIADVTIMLEQMKGMFNCSETVDKIKVQKLERLKQRLEDGTA